MSCYYYIPCVLRHLQTIVLKIWYPKTQRYDVYYEGEFVYPTNVEPDTFNIIQSENPEEEFVPKVTSTVSFESLH